MSYRNPAQLPEGGVLVVGASATGVQLASEIHRSGRPVTLSVGEHVRLPRMYRGRDVLWWMDASGVWNQRYDEIDDLTRARGLPSPQLVGTPERATLDLNALSSIGVRLVGRLAAVRDGRALFSGGLRNQFALGRPQDGSAARHVRRVGARASPQRGCRRSRTLRAHARSGFIAAASRSDERRDPLDCLGDRISSRLQLARRAGARPQGSSAPRRRHRRRSRTVRDRPADSSDDANPRSSTAPKTTRAISWRTSPATWAERGETE